MVDDFNKIEANHNRLVIHQFKLKSDSKNLFSSFFSFFSFFVNVLFDLFIIFSCWFISLVFNVKKTLDKEDNK